MSATEQIETIDASDTGVDDAAITADDLGGDTDTETSSAESRYLDALAKSLNIEVSSPGSTAGETKPDLKLAGTEADKPEKAKAESETPDFTDDELANVEDEVGPIAAKIIKSLVAQVNSLKAPGKHTKLLEDIEKIAPRLGDLERVSAREAKKHWKDIHAGLDQIAEEGGAELVGKNKADREANFAKYEKAIRTLYAKGQQEEARAEDMGVDKSQGECMVDVWNSIQKRTAAANPKADPATNPGLRAMQEANRVQARRGNPAAMGSANPRSGQRPAVAGAEGGLSLVKQFLKAQSA